MIFISHNHRDKQIVESIALRLAGVFGTDVVFYDSWSIQPGEGIIEKMNKGLSDCKYFFFFVSKNSLQSEMVKLEWQNALLKATSGQAKLIPVKIDDCMMPVILLQTLYIDIFGKGLEVGLRQMIDVINGDNTFRQIEPQQFENVRAYVTKSGDDIEIEIRAEYYLEPISRYMILVSNQKHELDFNVQSDNMIMAKFDTGIQLNNGDKYNAYCVSVERGTAPNFPFVVKVTPKEGVELKSFAVMRAISHEEYKMIPLISQNEYNINS